MKYLLLYLLFFLVDHTSFAQTEGPKEITPQVLQKIKTEVEKRVSDFKKYLSKQELTADQIEFSTDTFRIEQMASIRMDIDYSTAGMNRTINEKTASYDKEMNKYYNKLLQLLKVDDRKILVSAQKAWLVYRDAEARLIGTMAKNEYSGGGTIQSTVAAGFYSDLILKRVIEIFTYYDSIKSDK
jgi:uncharacterized protein YecT (DUF1311 family)